MDGERRRRFQVTERDLAIVRWIGRQRFAEAGQVSRRFAMDGRNTYRRLHGLVGAGLLAHRQVFHREPGVYWSTHAGLGAIELALPVAGIDVRTYRHDQIATEVLIELEREFGPDEVVTERELRSHDTTADSPRYSARLAGERAGLHFPDLAVDVGGGPVVAVEVELSAKGRRRLDTIVAGYVRARHIGKVRYYVSPGACPGLERAIARARASELFDLRAVEGPVR